MDAASGTEVSYVGDINGNRVAGLGFGAGNSLFEGVQTELYPCMAMFFLE